MVIVEVESDKQAVQVSLLTSSLYLPEAHTTHESPAGVYPALHKQAFALVEATLKVVACDPQSVQMRPPSEVSVLYFPT